MHVTDHMDSERTPIGSSLNTVRTSLKPSTRHTTSVAGPVLNAILQHMWPLKFREYRGIFASASVAFGAKPGTIRRWLYGNQFTVPVWACAVIADYLRRHGNRSLELAAEIERVGEDAKAGQQKRDWMQVRERDGPGSEPRDNRWSSRRRRTKVVP